MRNEYHEDSQQNVFSETRQEIRQLARDIEHLQESVERSESEARRTRGEVEQHQNELLANGRKSKGLWAAVIVIACALIGVTWYGLPQLWNDGKEISELMGMKDMLSAAQNKIGSIEDTLTDLAGARDKLAERVATVEKTAGASLGRARTQAQQLIAQAEQRMRAEMNQGLNAVQARVAKIETDQDADRSRLVSLQSDLARIQREIAGIQNSTDQQITDVRQNVDRNYSDLSRRFASSKSEFDSLTNRLGHTRTDFEIPKDRIEEVIPGLRLKVNHTDVGYQRVDAWMQIISDGNTLWVRGQGIQQPVTFFTLKEDRAYQVVFTRVTAHEILGYVLTPNPVGPSGIAAVSTSKTLNE